MSIPPLVSLHTTANPSLSHSTLLYVNLSLFTSNSKPAGIISASLSILHVTSLHIMPCDLQWQHLTFSNLFRVVYVLLWHARLWSSITEVLLYPTTPSEPSPCPWTSSNEHGEGELQCAHVPCMVSCSWVTGACWVQWQNSSPQHYLELVVTRLPHGVTRPLLRCSTILVGGCLTRPSSVQQVT
jgi:hypothetical protein